MLPTLRAATVAVLFLLVGVGVADILTQVGGDSSDASRPAALSGDTSGETAMQPPGETTDLAREPAPNDVAPGDGTGGGGILAETGSESAVGIAGESVGSLEGDTSAVDEDAIPDAPIRGAVPRDPASASETGANSESQSVLADEAPQQVSDEDAPAPEEAGSDDSFAAAPAAPAAADGGETGAGVSAATEPAPTVAIVAAAPDESTGSSSIAEADTVGTSNERAASTADPGISNWRLIEIVLAVALIALAALVIGLHRLSDRARRIGVIR